MTRPSKVIPKSSLVSDVARFIRRENMLRPGEPVRIGLSGGVDSMVLLHVLRALDHPCSAAHVDHGLRGPESDADRQFAEAYCAREGIQFHSTTVDVKGRAATSGLSAQMAARELRYAWFAELWKEQPIPIALAHHADDAVETLFINLLRGTGLHGWSTIRPVSGVFVRPLLCVGREVILNYAAEHGIPFREDTSNADPKYLRNRIRHEVLPLLEQLRPGAARAMARSIHNLRDLETAGRMLIEEQLDPAAGDHLPVRVAFDRIGSIGLPGLFLNRLLRHRGFHPDTIERIRAAIEDRATGAMFTAGTWRVNVDRDALLISPSPDVPTGLLIEEDRSPPASCPFQWSFQEDPGEPGGSGGNVALLDAASLGFPLELRPWRAGDRIRPVGLGGSRLVSDILTDAKVPMEKKHDVFVLVRDNELVWLVGHRVAEGYQATEHTRRVFRIERMP